MTSDIAIISQSSAFFFQPSFFRVTRCINCFIGHFWHRGSGRRDNSKLS